ncbi:hypothetical protein ACROYT_G024866 [Oculina patagonica]
MHPLLEKALLRVVFFYTYGLFVAWIFTLVEKTNESAQDKMKRTLLKLKEETYIKFNMTDNEFESLVTRAAAAVMEGDQLDWTFLNSCGFVFAALTTIGYGHITPKTQLGQGITIIACIIGIPIAMLAFKTSGELLAASFRFLVVKTETVMLKKAEPKHVKKKTFSVATALMVVLVILSALSSTYYENWTFMEGLYAWFITFTTIGFGDYVQFESHARKVAQGESPKTSLLVHGIIFAVPYVVGLSLMSCILNCLVDSVDHIRNFRDRTMNCCLGFISPIKRLPCCTSYDLAAEEPSHEQNELSSV